MRLLRSGLIALLLCLWALQIYQTATDKGRQWDFRTFYYAALAQSSGSNPYDLGVLSGLSGGSVHFKFLYPLVTTYLFRPFVWLPFQTAYYLWLGLKLCALALLLVLWQRVFLRRVDPLIFQSVVLLGFNGALVWDLKAGNVAIFEQLLLWTGFYYYLKGRDGRFSIFIVIASLFKLSPVCFLGLLLMPNSPRRRKVALVAGGMVGLGLLAVGPYLLRPDLLPWFTTNALNVREIGSTTPCFLALCDQLCNHVLGDGTMARNAAAIAYLAYVAVVLAVSYKPMRIVARSQDRLAWLVSGVILYAMLVPRLKCYSYGMVIVPAVLLVETLGSLAPGKAGLALLLAFPMLYNVALPNSVTNLIQNYYPWLQLTALWLCWLWKPCYAAKARGVPDDETAAG